MNQEYYVLHEAWQLSYTSLAEIWKGGVTIACVRKARALFWCVSSPDDECKYAQESAGMRCFAKIHFYKVDGGWVLQGRFMYENVYVDEDLNKTNVKWWYLWVWRGYRLTLLASGMMGKTTREGVVIHG